MVRITKWRERREQLAIMIDGWQYEDYSGEYAEWIVRHFQRRGERALIRARQRYVKQVPARVRASALRSAYGHKGR